MKDFKPLYQAIEKQLREIIKEHGKELIHSQNEFGAGRICVSVQATVAIGGEDHVFALTLDVDPGDDEEDEEDDEFACPCYHGGVTKKGSAH